MLQTLTDRGLTRGRIEAEHTDGRQTDREMDAFQMELRLRTDR